jgi:hypothetical protein
MRHRKILSIALAVGLIGVDTAPALGATTLAPKAPALVPFTITDHVDFASPVSTFTATGPLCPEGTFVDDAIRGPAGHPDSSRQLNLLNQTVYTCADGSGTFNALRHTFITIAPDDSFTSTGPIQFLGGTGTFADLAGHGVDNATSVDGGTGVIGQISGFVVQR